MDELTFTEKKLLKEYFEMESGYFLNMADEEFLQLFKQFGVDIENTKYTSNGEHQIDRFSSFLEIEDKDTILKILKESHQYKKHFVKRRRLVNPTELRLQGVDPLIDIKIADLIDRLSGKKTQLEDELEDGKEKGSAKNTVENSIKSSMRLAKRGLKKKKEELSAPKILNHMIVKDQRKLLEKHSEDLCFYVPGSKGSEDHLEKWSREIFKED